MKIKGQVYDSIAAMEPMLPNPQRGELAELSREIFIQAGRLNELLPAVVTREKIGAAP